MNRFQFSCLSSMALALLVTNSPLAGEINSREAAFQIQGEYHGRIVLPGFPRESGLQVVATSETTFDAYLLGGGLPGAGWDRQNRVLYQGSGSSHVTFTNPESPLSFRYLEAYPGCLFVFRNGYRIGTFRKLTRVSPTMHLPAPERAIILFNGKDEPRLKNVRVNSNGTLGIGAETIDQVQNMRLHVEFKTPFEPHESGQGRGNSGIYIQRRYEVQILDSFGLELEPNRCGGLYKQKSADINMALPPETWQTYDIYFYAAKFDESGKRTHRARITVVQNGVRIHDDYELLNKTGAGRPESPSPGPIWFQDHRNKVQFRNLWMVSLADGEVLASDRNPAYGILPPEEKAPAVKPANGCELMRPKLPFAPGRFLFRR